MGLDEKGWVWDRERGLEGRGGRGWRLMMVGVMD